VNNHWHQPAAAALNPGGSSCVGCLAPAGRLVEDSDLLVALLINNGCKQQQQQQQQRTRQPAECSEGLSQPGEFLGGNLCDGSAAMQAQRWGNPEGY
jgi:hypothetical protein